MDIDNELLLKSFVAETEEGLAQMEQALLELELHPDDEELVSTVFRVVHSFKGNAAIFELKYAQEFAPHRFQPTLSPAHENPSADENSRKHLFLPNLLTEYRDTAARGNIPR